MMTAITFSHIVRIIVIAEIFFTVGFLAARIWKRREHPFSYLSLMAWSVIFYSIAIAGAYTVKYDEPLTWRTPLVFAGSTVAFIAVVRGNYSEDVKEGGRD